MEKMHGLLVLLAVFQAFFISAKSQSYIGVNYGQVADNLPPAEATARLLESTTISKLRLYGADPGVIQALAGTNISIVIGASNGDIPSLAADPSTAAGWVAANVLPYVPASVISVVSVGNEVLNSGDPALASQLLPAMQNLQSALSAAAGPAVKVSTVHSMAVLSQSDPPSSGAFHSDLSPALNGVLGFLQQNGSPFMINPYPYFAYRSDPRPETLAFCLFQANAGRLDAGSGITYTNMFDAQLDAVRAALNAAGFPAVEIVVAETGWPYRGDDGEVGATVENAVAFNGGLVTHLRSMTGTPLMPGRSVDTYFFALYDEDLKPGPTSERSFGLFRPDLTMTYDAGLLKSNSSQVSPVATPSAEAATRPGVSCVSRARVSEAGVQANLDHACEQSSVNCSPIQPGGGCYVSNTVGSHAAFAMNLLYQIVGRNSWNCDFGGTATLTSDDPSSFTRLRSDLIGSDNNDYTVGICRAAVCWSFGFTLSFLLYVALPMLLVTL